VSYQKLIFKIIALMTKHTNPFDKAIALFDDLNRADPNQEFVGEEAYPKELLYSQRMTDRLHVFDPDASEALQLAARCQHLCRWEIPRSTFPLGRKGYNQWRSTLRKLHADKAGGVLAQVGYKQELIERVQFLVLKKQLKKDQETQTLEDVICLVFLEFYFAKFAEGHPDEKVIDILQKTWRKMSKDGQTAAFDLPLSPQSVNLIQRALL